MGPELQSALNLWGPALRRGELLVGQVLALLMTSSEDPRLQRGLKRLLQKGLPPERRRDGCIEAARLLKEQRQPRLALICLEALADLRDHDPELWLLQGELERLSGNLEAAEPWLQRATSASSCASAAAYQLGELNRSLGAFDQAARFLLKSLEGDPLNRYTHNALHYTRFSAELLPEVLDAYAAIAENHPEHGLVHHLHSHYLLRHGDTPGSALIAQQAARLDLAERTCHLEAASTAASPPDFVILGVPKGGTSSLLAWLGSHPQLWVHPRKELHFFDIGWHHGPDWYCNQFPRFQPSSCILRGEATPNYFQLPEVPHRLQSLMPQAKLLLLLRDPLERALSWIAHLKRHEGLHGDLESLLLEELNQLQELTPEQLSTTGFRWPNALLGSCYDAPLHRWQQLFGPDQLLVLRSEALFNRPQATLRQIAHFLGIQEDWDMGFLPPFNQSPTGKALELTQSAAERIKLFLDENNAWLALQKPYPGFVNQSALNSLHQCLNLRPSGTSDSTATPPTNEMSFAISTVLTLSTSTNPPELSGGTVSTGNSIVTSSEKPVVAKGTATVALGTTNATLVLGGKSEFALATDAAGNPLDIGGAVISATGNNSKVINLTGADVSGATVSASALPSITKSLDNNTFNTFIKTAGGSDQVQGSSGTDLIATGKGTDTVSAGAGNDAVVIDGSGSKKVTLGQGSDVLAIDLNKAGGSTKTSNSTVTDFTSGQDKIVVDGNSKTKVTGYDTQKLTISSGGKKYAITSESGTFSKDDIQIV